MRDSTLSDTVVAVATVRSGVRAAVMEAMEGANWRRHIPQGSRVALKPNLCWDLPLPGAQTSPWFLDAVISVMKPHVGDIVVVEAGQVTVDADRALERCGLGRVLEKHGIGFVNMSRGAFDSIHDPNAAVLRHLEVPEVLNDRLLVTLPVLKTHSTTTITGALKNQWGCLRELRHNHHLVVDQAIADVNAVLRPVFAVMDGTVGLEGNGPKTGRPRVCDLVLASSDLVALDATAARIMGFEPNSIPHLLAAADRGLGTLDPELAASELPGVRFRPARPGLIQLTEFALRRSRLRRFAFETSALSALAFAAKTYNHAWYAMFGRGARRRIILGTRYGPQWLGAWEPSGGEE